MTHLTTSKNRKPGVLSGRISIAAFSAVAAAALMFSAGSAQAGPADLAAIKKDLLAQDPPLIISGKPKGTQQPATYEDIVASVQRVIAAQATAKKPLQIGNIIGEALKTTQVVQAPTAGADLAQIAINAIGATPAADVVSKLVGYAAKTSATSKGANVVHIPTFVQEVLANDDANNTQTFAAALLASKSKTAVAAILEGRAANFVQGDDTARTALVNAAIADKALVNSVTEISRAIGAQIDDSATFAEQVGIKLVETKKTSFILKVVPGIVAANAEDAGDITAKLLELPATPSAAEATLKSTVIKGISSYAKAVAAVADIEQISVVGARLAQEIGANTAGAKVGVAAGLAKTLALAIFSKPVPAEGAGYTLTSSQGALTIANRADEIAEVAAYVVGGIMGNTAVVGKNNTFKTLNATVLGVIKGAIAGSVNKKAKEVTAGFAAPGVKDKLILDIAASVALTVNSYLATLDTAISDPVKAKLEAFLIKNATLKSIAGKSVDLQNQVKNAIQVALGSVADTDGILGKLEDGFLGRNNLGALIDPETDNKGL